MILLFVLLLCVIGLWARSRHKRNPHDPPVLPGALPLLGHAHILIGSRVKLWKTLKQVSYNSLNAGGVLLANIGPRIVYGSTICLLTDPDDCLTVANQCLQKDTFYQFAKPWLGDGLITGSLPVWKRHRKLLNPAFGQQVIDGFLDVFNSQSRRLVLDMEKEVGEGPFDHSVYTRHNALETICLTALGINFNENSVFNSEYVHATEQIFELFAERFKNFWLHNHFIFKFSNLKKKQDECLKILHNMSNTVLQKRKAEYIKNRQNGTLEDTKFKPFLDLLLELSIEKGAFTDQEIREEVDTIIVSGHDTSASVMMYTLLLIGSYPRVQEKMVAELQEVFGNDHRDVTKFDLSRLVYMEAVLKESMRMYPIIPVTARYIDEDVKLKNYTLKSGRAGFILIYGIHRHPMWGPDAEEFKPERWLDPATLPESRSAFAAFNLGRRNCLGKSYAFMSMKTTLSHFLRNYEIFGDHTKMVLKLDSLLKPESGHYVSIKKRTVQSSIP